MARFEDTQNYVKYARDVARSSWHFERRQNCLDRADELQAAIKKFEQSWSREDLVALNGAFVRCFQSVELIVPGGGDDPLGGRLKVELEKQRLKVAAR